MPKCKFSFSILNILILIQQTKKLIIVSNMNVYKIYTNSFYAFCILSE